MNDSPRHKVFLEELVRHIPRERVFTDELTRLTWGADASFYHLVPRIVVRVVDEQEVSALLRIATMCMVPVTFRAAGTGLSGQSITDSVLVVAARDWENYSVSEDGSVITLQPGIVGQQVNDILRPYGRCFGPDPASIRSAMVGGIISNNASGMNAGTHANSDRMLRSMRIVFSDGTVLDTADPASRAAFERARPGTVSEIRAIRDFIHKDHELQRRIRHKYSIKNVTGLNLLPFVIYEDPFDIIAHCMVGSEGTLGFISQATMATEHLYPYSASAMVYFDDMAQASRCVVALKKEAPVFSCEMLDKKSLSSVHDTTGTGLTALLLETKADSPEELRRNIEAVNEVVERMNPFKAAHFSSDPAVTSEWWNMRSGIFPAVAGTRPSGTTAIIEDIAFYINDLPTATVELARILEEDGYEDACIYGHALEGNYHFVIAQDFTTPEGIAKYRKLVDDVERLVVNRYDGSLKAEHGVGRNMAPFVRREWGDKAWMLMRRLKDAFDPSGILNPGVIFNDDPDCYVKDLKILHPTHPLIDKCIECGFCASRCVSYGLTLSARQRNVAIREISRLRESGSPEDVRKAAVLEEQFRYPGVDSCAGDGLCSTACPMKINTADIVHVLREKGLPVGSSGYKLGAYAARHLGGISRGLRLALGAADLAHRALGDKATDALGRGLHRAGFPLWTAALPRPYSPKRTVRKAQPSSPRKVVYFPSCLNRAMGPSSSHGETDRRPLVDVMVGLCRKAGFEVIFPENMDGLCCGMIWESKGMPDVAEQKIRQLEQALMKASDGGRYPVLCDQSPCLHRMRENIASMHLYEPAEFISLFLAPRLRFIPDDTPVAVHVTCSTRRMGLADCIIDLARRCSTRVTVPEMVGCCGFAGDKGFTLPELNKWALRRLPDALRRDGVRAGYSNSRTCEIGLTTNGGVPYKSIAYLVDDHTEPLSDV